ncbi:hypothetical protein [Natrialba sp. INN-245]|uniref:hypothetical protein n=1 Tax=Natrialba sp. INN-245 TaxID=2690967 RepID=UPI001312A8E5|nr:hypothetical protein [Natrialba sp. INN-245]MWV38859.1 hypothetical protein [Natrialba sp. INN-245]
MTLDDLDPHDVPGSDRALGVDDPIPDSEYGDQGHCPERSAVDGGQAPIDELHGALLEAERTLRKLDEQLPDPLTLNSSLTEIRATADAYTRLDAGYREDEE